MNPFQINEPTCISFSGGRTSAYMLWRILEANDGKLPDEAIVCFANTGKEDEATLRFVQACSDNWNVEIHWLEYRDADPAFARVDFQTASRNGEPFEAIIRKRQYLPNPVTRFCTSDLKIRTIHKYLKSLGWHDHNETMDWIGMRADEQRRAAKIADKSRIPLVIAGVTKETVGEFWRNQTFDLELPNINGVTYHGNCDLCFLKGGSQVLSLIAEKPERGIWWAKMEEMALSIASKSSGAVFRSDRPSYSSMIKFSESQIDMFDKNEEAIACFCGD
jgi:3'-phosphoadenosine 5'-phosphosulfate sulfotransferase (PAPS reductase)/FAD synthetase